VPPQQRPLSPPPQQQQQQAAEALPADPNEVRRLRLQRLEEQQQRKMPARRRGAR
jgi:hypothetical protein